jgi:peptide/nickel transport system ATP-binding protein
MTTQANHIAPPILSVSNLTIRFPGQSQPVINNVDLQIQAGSCHGVVGESGSGKSLTAMAIVGLLPSRAEVTGEIRFNGQNILALTAEQRRRYRRDNLGVIFQDPMTALDPRLNVATQLRLALPVEDRAQGRHWVIERSAELLEQVGIPNPGERLANYPFELSGGLCQRVMIAMAIARRPRILVADEPTTALDVSVQAQILDLIDELRASLNMSVLLISHELGIMADRAATLSVMQQGEVIEAGAAGAVLGAPAQDYTIRLLKAQPKIEDAFAKPPPSDHTDRDVLLRLRNISKSFSLGSRRRFKALDDVSLDVRGGDSVGIVGESGSGKTTLARIIVGLERPDTGSCEFGGENPGDLVGEARRRWRRSTQLIFQDPLSSLDPYLTVRRSVEEPLKVAGFRSSERTAKARDLFAEVGLAWDLAERRPSQLSGGQRQRVGIARALALGPSLLVADEPVSALDVSVQARILALLSRLRERRHFTQITISHDLAVIGTLCDTVVVLRRGQVVERGLVRDVFRHPAHPYTRSLLAAVPGQSQRWSERFPPPEPLSPVDPNQGAHTPATRPSPDAFDGSNQSNWIELGRGHGFNRRSAQQYLHQATCENEYEYP